MKKLLLVSVILLAAVMALAVPAVADTSMTDKYISVAGYGESETTPDVVTLNLGVSTENTNAAKAQSENRDTMNRVISALKSAGIAADDISTNGYSMYSYTVSEYDEGVYKAGTIVYRVSNQISVKTSKVESAGSYIDTAVSAGANTVNNVVFSLSNAKYLEERKHALTAAVKSARSDAEAVAGALGLSLKGTGVITIDQSYVPVAYNTPMPVMTKEYAVTGDSSTAIQAGTLKTTATVSITYLY